MTGECPDELARRQLGPFNHSRWGTLGERILFYYMTFLNPPMKVQRLANFTLKHYASPWFKLRVRWRITEASQVFFEMYQRLDDLLEAERKVVLPVYERAFFWRHPESLLLGCLASSETDVRKTAVHRILNLRQARNEQQQESLNTTTTSGGDASNTATPPARSQIVSSVNNNDNDGNDDNDNNNDNDNSDNNNNNDNSDNNDNNNNNNNNNNREREIVDFIIIHLNCNLD